MTAALFLLAIVAFFVLNLFALAVVASSRGDDETYG